MNHGEYAAQLFVSGYNCAQAVAVAFCDLTGLTPEQAAKMASPFGGGFGRQREVCGAVSGMCLVLAASTATKVPTRSGTKYSTPMSRSCAASSGKAPAASSAGKF